MFAIRSLFAFALALAVCTAARGNEDLYRKVAPSTALIYVNNGTFGGSGTGFLIDAQEGLLFTARHVLEKPQGGLVDHCTVFFAQFKEGEIVTELAHYRKDWQAKSVPGKVIFDSVRRDLAVIQVDKVPPGVKALELATGRAKPGQMIHVIGNSSERFGGAFNYCQGYVRNVFHWNEMGTTVVATHAPTNKGDSGGPMFNNLGEVVGIAAMSTIGSQLPKNSPFFDVQVTNFSICVSEMRDALQELRQRKFASRANPDTQRAVILEGRSKQTVHTMMMEKDVLYRLHIKADGFSPEARVDNLLIPAVVGGADFNQVQYLYTPKETKEHRIQVSHLPGRDLGAGPFTYTLSIDQMTFETETTLKEPELKLNEHARNLEAGKIYKITVRGKGFEPDLQLVDGTKTVLRQANNGLRKEGGTGQRFFETIGLARSEFETSFTFMPPKTAEYRLLVAVGPFSPSRSGVLPYVVEYTEHKVDFSATGRLASNDPLHPQGGPSKGHTVKMLAGKTYQIDLFTTAFDSKLLLEDPSGKVVMKGIDADGFNSRLIFRPTLSGIYRIIATSHQGVVNGDYTLTMGEVPGVVETKTETNKETKTP